ncbi:cytochrome c-type biogenesis protein CcmH [Polymorphospora sp. NPDC051019]|uniref:cytochrome c-type biogenesis protein CcmH n=1 Tax=Polymorphospora sp. NPDC051019 TaxID=3155725 RepID=UPI00344654D3
MNRRRALGAAVLVLLTVAAGVALFRSAAAGDDPARSIAAGLRCPSCQGESVADSSSPVAAAMRQVVADQLAQGRSPDEIRHWFTERYGDDVLADPPLSGPGVLLWAVPALVLLGSGYAAVRTLRPAGRRTGVPVGPAGGPGRRTAWRLGAVGLVAMVGAVAFGAAQVGRPAGDGGPPDPAAVAVLLARDLEQQGRYADAARMYRQALETRPDVDVRLRLAFTLVRAGAPADAEQEARRLLAGTPDLPDALLVLGLAQRETSPDRAPETLRRFLDVAPGHPAAGEVRRLLAPDG